MGRIQKNLKVRKTFYILTNGKETERNYFELVKSKKSIYDVKVEFHNDDPAGLVKIGAQLLKSRANQVWCVFDIDDTFEEGSLIASLKLSSETGVNIVFSNLAFEVWLLSHYGKVEKTMNNSQLLRAMDELLLKILGETYSYNKSDKNILKKHFLPKLDDAVTNSKVIYQKRVAEHEKQYDGNKGYRIWEWNPCTNVYMLIEALQLKK